MKPAPPSSFRPRAITMWDFSWLERRWPGAGYEDWGRALDELAERGYDAVRIDAYPHLIHRDGLAEYELLPVWSVNDWGAPMRCRVRVLPALTEFIAACGARGIGVGLSSWYRRDTGESWRALCTPERHAASWLKTLDAVREAGLMEHILYVDLCNEWPLRIWAPFYYGQDEEAAAAAGGDQHGWDHAKALAWMEEAMQCLRREYPELPLTFSTQMGGDWSQAAFCDFWDPHIWMAGGEFYHRLPYTFQHKFDYREYENVQLHAENLYRADPAYWQHRLRTSIDTMAAHSRAHGRPLITTECWGIVDYKDGPMLDWGWVKELCAFGVEASAETGCWIANATSNFCGPQFVGMWRDVEWHRRLTDRIRSARPETPPPEIFSRFDSDFHTQTHTREHP